MCSFLRQLRRLNRSVHTKLYGSKEELEKTATFHLADWTLSVLAIEKKKSMYPYDCMRIQDTEGSGAKILAKCCYQSKHTSSFVFICSTVWVFFCLTASSPRTASNWRRRPLRSAGPSPNRPDTQTHNIYIHEHTHTVTHTCTHTHACTHTHIQKYTHTCTHTQTHVHTRTHAHTHAYTYRCTYKVSKLVFYAQSTSAHTETHTCVYIHAHTHTEKYIHVHANTHHTESKG